MKYYAKAVLPRFFLLLVVQWKDPTHWCNTFCILRASWATEKVASKKNLVKWHSLMYFFWDTKILYNISSFGGFINIKCSAHFNRRNPRLIIDSHNVQIWCVKGNLQQKTLNYIFTLNEDMVFYNPKGS